MKLDKAFALVLFKRILDVGIILSLITVPIVIATGGFKIEIFGSHIRASHLYTPLRVLIPLVAIRLLITIRIRDFIVVLISVFVALLGVELILRIWDPPMANPRMAQIHRTSPVFSYELVPGSSGVGGFGEVYRINSAGFRDTEHPLKKPEGLFRIMVIGDSFTFGPKVNLADTYPKQLERILNRKSPHHEVINCGVIGYDMWQYVEVLKRKAIPHEPDMVILGLFLNDIADPVPPHRDSDDWEPRNPFEPEGISEASKYSALCNYLRNINYRFEATYRYRRGWAYLQGIKKRNREFGPDKPESTWHKIMYGKLEKKTYRDFRSALKEFVDAARAEDIRLLVLMIPDAAQLHDTGKQAVNAFVARSCRQIGVPFVDATPVLEKEEDPRPLYLFPKDPHNSPEGYRLIARAAADKIRDLGVTDIPSKN